MARRLLAWLRRISSTKHFQYKLAHRQTSYHVTGTMCTVEPQNSRETFFLTVRHVRVRCRITCSVPPVPAVAVSASVGSALLCTLFATAIEAVYYVAADSTRDYFKKFCFGATTAAARRPVSELPRFTSTPDGVRMATTELPRICSRAIRSRQLALRDFPASVEASDANLPQ